VQSVAGTAMARLGRYFLPDQPLHVIQRGNNREATFFAEDDYACYRDWLAAASAEYGYAIHAYVLMTNHVHLLVTPGGPQSLPRTMQSLGRRYVRHVMRRIDELGHCGKAKSRHPRVTFPLPALQHPIAGPVQLL
jgi:putative transposase